MNSTYVFTYGEVSWRICVIVDVTQAEAEHFFFVPVLKMGKSFCYTVITEAMTS